MLAFIAFTLIDNFFCYTAVRVMFKPLTETPIFICSMQKGGVSDYLNCLTFILKSLFLLF
jgi:hypothetical protein